MQCELCGQPFSRRDYYNTHIRTKHGGGATWPAFHEAGVSRDPGVPTVGDVGGGRDFGVPASGDTGTDRDFCIPISGVAGTG